MTLSIEAMRDQTIERLRSLGSRDARYRFIIGQGKAAEGLPDELKSADHIVEGCLAKTWFVARPEGERFRFLADSEAVIIRGIMAILLPIYDGRTRAEIAQVSPHFLSELGILETLSASRRNGLAQICRGIVALGEQA